MAGATRTRPQTAFRVLVTGFEPFDNDRLNSSWEVARALDATVIHWPAKRGRPAGQADVVARRLPCVFERANRSMSRHIRQLDPDLVIALGQANSRTDVSVERIAINVNDARIADNAGAQPIDTAVVTEAPAAYFATLPIKAIVMAMRQAGLPAGVSQTAGTFVCNHVFYGLMHLLATQYPNKRGGFIHLPLLPEQAAQMPGMASVSRATMQAAIQTAIRISCTTRHDRVFAAGAVD